ncbi:MAG: hypothetical protein GTO03_01125 [Planctomycetales bacterium]|nr:hypothetical protein [Planctomycetales bacterium]
MQLQERGRDRGQPPGPQAGQHQGRIAQPRQGAGQGPEPGDQQGLGGQQTREGPLTKAEGQQQADFGRPLLDPQPKQEGDQHQGGGHQKGAEHQE